MKNIKQGLQIVKGFARVRAGRGTKTGKLFQGLKS